eukprot:gnl/TRDRNA2_/TRDRNA2_51596_c0_seq1.p1 gnl/TRDRNA2_/TRDRNA2_51596_c0~~gnl/TRDRNA2_/TRDRNA2_51596_c0_seq1.p1  ORF type:complete len:286 (-),score=39.54 gnl/TRDRNA2_/TRDRNA2_51596_c0_seq1:401-1258(-)
MTHGHSGDTKRPVPAAGQSSAPPLEATLRTQCAQELIKTKLCSFNLEGCCTRGSACTFAHNEDELKTRPSFFRTSLCKSMRQHGRCDDSDCKFAHSRKELRPRTATWAVQSRPESPTSAFASNSKAPDTPDGGNETFEQLQDMINAPAPYSPYVLDGGVFYSVDLSQAALAYEVDKIFRSPMHQNMDKKWVQPIRTPAAARAASTAVTLSLQNAPVQNCQYESMSDWSYDMCLSNMIGSSLSLDGSQHNSSAKSTVDCATVTDDAIAPFLNFTCDTEGPRWHFSV